ncbi:ZIP family metal transporter [Fusobacterium sp. FSA-380-WT-3A]|uniref:ZIP family metal transporter n=1 Tax=Fusobacterium sp. FSA-380-WT-3A TaxID=2725304 RepID=UPI0014768BE5|nr:ZIP family metal transporter [Fusobacterium sp. FSA-380-WT-3A]NME35259.1 ZIP family metal transporter [Fusobacterium sp. FSA-380-WT-3A]
MFKEIYWTFLGTTFIFLMTTLGSSMVFFFKKEIKDNVQRIFLGFAAGIMISASMFGLLTPAIEQAEVLGMIGWVPAATGFLGGVFFILLLDKLIPHLHSGKNKIEGVNTNFKRTSLLMTAVTLHNIPEGIAIGLSFALASQNSYEPSYLASAMGLALGIGIQNFPEGAAVSLPLRREGFSTTKAFILGSLSGIVEPIFGVMTVFISASLENFMPWLLSFSAGAMMYVVVEELIPEANLGEHSDTGTLSVMVGFALMMILDVALG